MIDADLHDGHDSCDVHAALEVTLGRSPAKVEFATRAPKDVLW